MLPKNQEKKDSPILVDEELKQPQGETCEDSLKKSLTTIENITSNPKLLAWSTQYDNKIRIAEIETKQKFAEFEGVKLNDPGKFSYAHVKEIANTRLLVSVFHNDVKSANLEVFELSRKGQTKKIYSYEEVSGSRNTYQSKANWNSKRPQHLGVKIYLIFPPLLVTGDGDVTYNSRRNFLGAICVGGKIAYHLYSFDTPKSDGIINLVRKSRWHSQYSTKAYNFIAGLDFNPNAETIATIDRYGACLISDVNTDSYRFHLNMDMEHLEDIHGRCRWSPNPDEPLLFVKYDWSLLNILDVEKQAFILKIPIKIESQVRGGTHWIDVCQSDGNLLASGGDDGNVNIFDKRESKIVQTVGSHKRLINCVRWSSSGDMIASASADATVALLNFKTGKKLYTGKTSGRGKFSLLD